MGKHPSSNGSVVNGLQLLTGLCVLLVGTMVYLSLRSPDQIYFTRLLGIERPVFHIQSPFLIFAGHSLPAFCHVLAFILITAAFIPAGRGAYAVVCTGWCLVECLFELGQQYPIPFVRTLFDKFDAFPFLNTIRNYFLMGTYDPFDLLAIALGTLLAYGVLCITSRPLKQANIRNVYPQNGG